MLAIFFLVAYTAINEHSHFLDISVQGGKVHEVIPM